MANLITWGWAGSALDGRSGDLLVALLDGLGHGAEAADAASAAAPVLARFAGEPVVELIRRCHDALRHTRGVVLSVASFRAADSTLTWTGVGNVDGALVRKTRKPERCDEAILVRGGIVGYRIPPLRDYTFAVAGDTLIMATGGVRSGFTTGLDLDDSPQEIAELVLARHAKGSDDAHVVVARYLGAGP